MALISKWTTGCEFNDLDTCGFNDVGNASIQGTVVHHGSYALELTNNEAGAHAEISGHPFYISERDETYYHFYFRFESAPLGTDDNWFFRILDGSSNISCTLAVYDRKIRAYDGEGNSIGWDTTILVWDTWYRIEVRLKAASTYGSSGDGVCQVKLNGSLVIDLSTEDNIRSSGRMQFLNSDKDTTTAFYFDDIISVDTSGSDMNSWIGDSRIEIETVDSVGHYNDFDGHPDTGADNWKNVDENPPDDSTSRNREDDEDETHETYEIFGASYAKAKRAVIIRIWGLAGTPPPMKAMVRYSGTDYIHELFTPGGFNWKGTTEVMDSPVYYDAPDASAWTNVKINALEVGGYVDNWFTARWADISWAGVEIIYDETTGEGAPPEADHDAVWVQVF